MKYLLFNNEILISDGTNVHRVDKNNNLKSVLGSIEKVRICVVDVDVLMAVAPESPLEKKDNLLVRKFRALYLHEPYILQDERIEKNLFQIVGIKEQQLRDIYSLVPSDQVEFVIPYGMALRNTLLSNNIDLNKTVVFVEDLGSERFLTVFDGLKFSRTRVIVNNGEDILPEIKRSQMDFFKKTEEYIGKNADFSILVNDRVLAAEISKNTEKLQVEYLNVAYPALEGLKVTNAAIKYTLPEENHKKRREIELKNKVMTLALSLCFVAIGLFYFLFNRIELGVVGKQCELVKQENERLDERLRKLDQETYREGLKRKGYLNYGTTYFKILELIPASYEVDSFKFTRSNNWNLQMSLSSDDGGFFDPIFKTGIFKNADIKDVFVNKRVGKRLSIAL